MNRISISAACLFAAMASGATATELPKAIQAQGEAVFLRVHAVGAQIYECKAGADGKLAWRFREPIATLILDGKTVGRHFAGPSWEVEGSVVVGKAAASAPGATERDARWLKVAVVERRGDGPLKDATTVQRIDTQGGAFAGACDKVGDLHPEPYAADYLFLKK